MISVVLCVSFVKELTHELAIVISNLGQGGYVNLEYCEVKPNSFPSLVRCLGRNEVKAVCFPYPFDRTPTLIHVSFNSLDVRYA